MADNLNAEDELEGSLSEDESQKSKRPARTQDEDEETYTLYCSIEFNLIN